MQNKSNVYTINDTAPPSYTEATGSSASRTQDYLHEAQSPQFDQRYPRMMVCPSPSAPFSYSYPPNSYVNRTPLQLAYPEQQSQPMNVSHGRTLVETRDDRTSYLLCCRLLWFVCVLIITIGVIVGIIYRNNRFNTTLWPVGSY